MVARGPTLGAIVAQDDAVRSGTVRQERSIIVTKCNGGGTKPRSRAPLSMRPFITALSQPFQTASRTVLSKAPLSLSQPCQASPPSLGPWVATRAANAHWRTCSTSAIQGEDAATWPSYCSCWPPCNNSRKRLWAPSNLSPTSEGQAAGPVSRPLLWLSPHSMAAVTDVEAPTSNSHRSLKIAAAASPSSYTSP